MAPAVRESLRFVIPLWIAIIVLLVVQAIWSFALAGVLFLLALFVHYFFRDPERTAPGGEEIIVAAADGRIVGVEEIDELTFGLGRCQRVSIYLNVFNVHVNRMPVAGTIKKTVYTSGQFLDVRHPDCSLRNENLAWLVETARGPIVVRQIAGLIARRIVPWAKEGDTLARGVRFGMIRFGSRTEVYMPLDVEILTQVGATVQGTATPIARWTR